MSFWSDLGGYIGSGVRDGVQSGVQDAIGAAGSYLGGGGSSGGVVGACAGENPMHVQHVFSAATPDEVARIWTLYDASSKTAKRGDNVSKVAHAIAGGNDCVNTSDAGKQQAAYWQQLFAKYPLPAGGWANPVPTPAQPGGGSALPPSGGIYYPTDVPLDGLNVQAPKSPAPAVRGASGLALLPMVLILGGGLLVFFLLRGRK